MTETTPANAMPVFRVQGSLAPDLARDCVRLEIAEGTEGLRTLQAHVATDDGRGKRGSSAPGRPGVRSRPEHPGQPRAGRAAAARLRRHDLRHRGRVRATASAPVVILYAEDALMRLRMTRRMRTYQRRHRRRHRRRRSPASMGCRRGRRRGRRRATTWCSSSTRATWRSCASGPGWCRPSCGATGTHAAFQHPGPRHGTELTRSRATSCSRSRLCADLAHQRSERDVTGYDARGQRTIDEQAGPEALDAEITGGRTGPRLVQRALAEQRQLPGPRGGRSTIEPKPGPGPRPRCCAGARRFVT